MANNQTVMATYDDGRKITAGQVNRWIAGSNVDELAKFLYQRLYRRYIKPFEYRSPDFKSITKMVFQ